MIREWFVAMRTIIVLLCLTPIAAWLLVPEGGMKAAAMSQVLSMGSLAIGFTIDWWRLQRRNRKRALLRRPLRTVPTAQSDDSKGAA